MATIILTGGGTAGHCTPHLALLPYIKNDFDKIYYIGSEDGIERKIIEQTDVPYYFIPCAKLDRTNLSKNFKTPLKVIKGIRSAGKILDELKPNIIFSKGGYVSLPTVIAAKRRKIPVIAHESDYSVGLANKISSRFCKKVLTSFPDTAKELKNGEFVGSPIRKSIFNVNKKVALESFGFNGKKPVLLVTGGSLGAKALNDALRSALPDLLPKYDVLHICGKNNISQEYTHKGYIQTEFVNKMENAFAVASVCVSRAGSNTLFELMSLKIPTLLVPLPKSASRGDQILNAAYFQKLGLAQVLFQENLSTESLVFAINSVYSNRLNLLKNFNKNPIKDSSRQISRILADNSKKI
jgi:UDP-N-acetylglucosamine--N-acetylmuramyl-(pentapeptide) pyrophosphoryl-undecaprenol N-acetylglucosamine transferase